MTHRPLTECDAADLRRCSIHNMKIRLQPDLICMERFCIDYHGAIKILFVLYCMDPMHPYFKDVMEFEFECCRCSTILATSDSVGCTESKDHFSAILGPWI